MNITDAWMEVGIKRREFPSIMTVYEVWVHFIMDDVKYRAKLKKFDDDGWRMFHLYRLEENGFYQGISGMPRELMTESLVEHPRLRLPLLLC